MSNTLPLPASAASGEPLEPMGLIAGWGSYPVIVARALKARGYPVICLGVRDHVDADMRSLCDEYREVGLGKLGGAIRYFQSHQVRVATMAGKIHKVVLLERLAWLKHLPDWTCIKTFYRHFWTMSRDRKDDTLLLAIVDAYQQGGVTLVPATDYVPEVLVKFGQLSGRRLSHAQRKDIEFGWQLAKEMGRLDVGQSVAVKGQAVLAVEAVEGTDQCIRRAGELCRRSGFTLVKVAKPQQDMRFDVPTIGAQTIENLVAAGARVLAVEADRTILLDEPAVIRLANQHGLTIVAVTADTLPQLADIDAPGEAA